MRLKVNKYLWMKSLNPKAYRAVHEALFNLMDAGLNKQDNLYTGKWKEKEQSSSIHGISITVSKADVLEYIGLCGYPECGDEI